MFPLAFIIIIQQEIQFSSGYTRTSALQQHLRLCILTYFSCPCIYAPFALPIWKFPFCCFWCSVMYLVLHFLSRQPKTHAWNQHQNTLFMKTYTLPHTQQHSPRWKRAAHNTTQSIIPLSHRHHHHFETSTKTLSICLKQGTFGHNGMIMLAEFKLNGKKAVWSKYPATPSSLCFCERLPPV